MVKHSLLSTLFCHSYFVHRDLLSFPHDALPICAPGPLLEVAHQARRTQHQDVAGRGGLPHRERGALLPARLARGDRKSTRLNSSHVASSYAVFCLKKSMIKHQSWKVLGLKKQAL